MQARGAEPCGLLPWLCTKACTSNSDLAPGISIDWSQPKQALSGPGLCLRAGPEHLLMIGDWKQTVPKRATRTCSLPRRFLKAGKSCYSLPSSWRGHSSVVARLQLPITCFMAAQQRLKIALSILLCPNACRQTAAIFHLACAQAKQLNPVGSLEKSKDPARSFARPEAVVVSSCLVLS